MLFFDWRKGLDDLKNKKAQGHSTRIPLRLIHLYKVTSDYFLTFFAPTGLNWIVSPVSAASKIASINSMTR